MGLPALTVRSKNPNHSHSITLARSQTLDNAYISLQFAPIPLPALQLFHSPGTRGAAHPSHTDYQLTSHPLDLQAFRLNLSTRSQSSQCTDNPAVVLTARILIISTSTTITTQSVSSATLLQAALIASPGVTS